MVCLQTPLLLAVEAGNYSLIKLLLSVRPMSYPC